MSDAPPPKHKRRPRYSGKYPRRFEEKYKELQPERYAEDVAKVIASGKTPAGMHRPILVEEILDVLRPQPGELGVDVTLGYGGHTTELLGRLQPGGRLLALDVDPLELPKTEARLRAAGFGPDQLVIARSNFAGLPRAMTDAGLPAANFILADLGLSSMQIDNPARGFTFKWAGPLDLRLNPERGQPASAFLASLTSEKLATLLRENADEPNALQLAGPLVEAAQRGRLNTTIEAAHIIRETLEGSGALTAQRRPRPETDAAVRRVFQAVRIAVNDEFGALEMLLRHLPGCLQSGGRVAILTFHSGEDRRVKQAFRRGQETGVYSRVADVVIRPSPEEIRANPRASSAKLRWAIRG
jgi:16S rRNA (cytosine1402-N4)-methyltransferase